VKWFLLVSGGAFLSLVLAAPWAHETFSAAHRWLGLGDLPTDRRAQHLASSLVLLYAFHGMVILSVASCRPGSRLSKSLLAALALAHLGFVGLDLRLGLPMFFVLFQGPPVFVLCVAVAYTLMGERQKDGSGS